MLLKEQLTEDLKSAMKQGDEVRKTAIRSLRAVIKNEEIDLGKELSDQDIQAVIVKQAKQRRDSMELFKEGNRPDLVAQEQKELEILEAYLPQQLSDDEIAERAKAVIEELGVTNMKGMGPVMGRLSNELKGRADGKRISVVVRGLLNQ